MVLIGFQPRTMLRPFLVMLPLLATIPVPRFWDGMRPMGAAAGNPNVLAASCVLWIPLALVVAGDRKRRWLVLVLATALVAAHRSEAALGGLAVALLVHALLLSPRRARTRVLAGLVAAGGAAAAWTLFADPTGTALVRHTIWRGAWPLWLEAPIAGHGLGTFVGAIQRTIPPEAPLNGLTPNVGHAHCEPLELLAELGAVGLLLAAIPLLLVARGVIGAARGDSDFAWRVAALAGIAGVAVDALASPNLRWIAVALPFWGLVGALGGGMPGTPLRLTRPRRAALLLPVGGIALALGLAELHSTWGSEGELLSAERHLIHGRPERALPHLLAAHEAGPRNPRLLYRIGIAHERRGVFGEAVTAYEAVRALDPRYARLPLHLAFCLLHAGRPEQARQVAGGAAPGRLDDELWSIWGEAALAAGNTSEALSVLDRMLELHRRHPPGTRSEPFLRRAAPHQVLTTRANLLAAIGRHADARRDYREAIRSDGPRNRLLAKIGRSYEREGRSHEAALIDRAMTWTLGTEIDPPGAPLPGR